MSIEFHCPQCSKVIRAPDSAGGKHGKCPYCEGKVYIPTAADDSEEIGLAPVDETDVQREQNLKKEAARYSAAMSRETDAPPETAGESPEPRASGGGPVGAPDDLDEAVEQFVLAMRDSKLDEADRIVKGLMSAGARAFEHVQNMIADPPPPAVADIPKPLYQGFLKTLLERLG